MRVKFNATKEECVLISKIADRAIEEEVVIGETNKLSLVMDIEACHSNGCTLSLKELLDADPLDFSHDICGIVSLINRKTGGLTNGFVPRYAAQNIVRK